MLFGFLFLCLLQGVSLFSSWRIHQNGNVSHPTSSSAQFFDVSRVKMQFMPLLIQLNRVGLADKIDKKLSWKTECACKVLKLASEMAKILHLESFGPLLLHHPPRVNTIRLTDLRTRNSLSDNELWGLARIYLSQIRIHTETSRRVGRLSEKRGPVGIQTAIRAWKASAWSLRSWPSGWIDLGDQTRTLSPPGIYA